MTNKYLYGTITLTFAIEMHEGETKDEVYQSFLDILKSGDENIEDYIDEVELEVQDENEW